jgi:hypothetical protein
METYSVQPLLEENVDYELIPSDGENWDVRLLEGPFPETVIAFRQLQVSECEEYMKFNFDIVSSPDPDLTDQNLELQQYSANVLSAILTNAEPFGGSE